MPECVKTTNATGTVTFLLNPSFLSIILNLKSRIQFHAFLDHLYQTNCKFQIHKAM